MINISTIIPSFNDAGTLDKTLNSIVNQTRKSDQVLVIDDGSKEDILSIVKRYPVVEYHRQENAGVSVARNIGVQKASSEWIAFCDADDVWVPEKLHVISLCLERFPQSCFLFHNFYLFGDRLETDYSGVADSDNTIFPFFRENKTSFQQIFDFHDELALNDKQRALVPIFYGNVFRWLVLGNFILPSSVVMQRDFFIEVGGFDPSFSRAEDTEFFLRLSKNQYLYYIDMPLTGYRLSHGGLTANVPGLLHNGMRALKKNAVDDPLLYSRFKKSIHVGIARRYGRIGGYWLKKKDRRQAWIYLFKGMRYAPFEKILWKFLIASLFPYSIIAAVASFLRKK